MDYTSIISVDDARIAGDGSYKPRRKPRSDRGKKRSTYDMSNREWKQRCKALYEVVHNTGKYARLMRNRVKLGRPLKEEKDSLNNRRHIARREALPEPRVCPVCNKVKMKSRQWVLLEAGQKFKAICLACYRKAR